MTKLKYYFFLLVLILVMVAFKYYSIQGKTEIKTRIENPLVEPEVNLAKEISDVLIKYDSLITSEINMSGTVGAAVVITYKNQIAFLKCFGVRKNGEKDSINKNTIFRLASVSKTVTGVLSGILSDENIIDLDDRIIEYIPDFRLKDPANTNQLKVRHILSHTSGLIPHAYDNFIEEHVPFQTIINKLDEVDISAPPGQMYSYQNVMFSLYDSIVSSKMSKSFGEVLQEKIFTPFKMDDATVGFEPFENSDNKAWPHYGSEGNFRSLKLNDRYYSTNPAAGVNASISDLAQFLITLSNSETSYVNDHVRELVFTPQVNSPLKSNYFRHWKNAKNKQYAIGWRTLNYKQRQIKYHGGYVRGYRAEIALCFDEQVGIAFLSNSPNTVESKSIPSFLDLLFEFKDLQKNEIVNP